MTWSMTVELPPISLLPGLERSTCFNRKQRAAYYIVITIIECDTRKYHKFIAEYCYECEARVTIPKAMNEWCFLGIAFYYGNNNFYRMTNQTNDWSVSSHTPKKQISISDIASNADCWTDKWEPTVEWTAVNNAKESSWVICWMNSEWTPHSNYM